MGKPKSKPSRKSAHASGENSALNVFQVDVDRKIKHQRESNLDEMERSKYEVDEVAPEDDEELDSDYAYEEVDEITPSVMKKKPRRSKRNSEEVSDEEELQGDGLIYLSELLDDEPSASLKPGSDTKVSYQDLLPIPEGSEVEEAPELSDMDDQGNDGLSEFVKKLDANPPKVRKFLKEQTETNKESEFNLALRPSSTWDRLSFADLLAPVKDVAGFTALEKKVLDFGGDKKALAPLAVPLAKRISDRVVRSTAYEHAKERISEWQPIIDQTREAEHLNFGKTPVVSTLSTLSDAATPETKLEKEINNLLVQGNLKDDAIQEAEKLEESKMSHEMVLARRRELRRMRELMFQNEVKFKRIAKIKSKAYHRILKKERERTKQVQTELGLEAEDRMEAEVARARERMSLKHKNTGKWAKALLKHGGRHSENQAALMEQLEEHQRLKRKMTGGESDQDSDEDSGHESVDADPREQAFREIDHVVSAPSHAATHPKGVMGMKFMQNAVKRQEQEVERMAQEAIEDLKLLNSDHEDAQLEVPNVAVEVQGNQGRLAFTGNGQPAQFSSPPPQPSFTLDEGGLVSKVSHLASHTTKLNGPLTISQPPKPEPAETNPWIVDPTDAPAVKQRKALDSNNEAPNKAQKLVTKLKKAQRQSNKELEPSPHVDVDAAMVIPDDPGEEIDADCQGTLVGDNPNAFTQKDLVKLAFAEDGVVQDFAQAKQQAIAEEAPQLADGTLPGWGCWGGKTITKQPTIKRSLIYVVKKGVEGEKRKDKDLQHVIINERAIQKIGSYTVNQLPAKFRAKSQFDLNLATPAGEEWIPSTSFHKKIKPRILTKQGHLIEPLAMDDH